MPILLLWAVGFGDSVCRGSFIITYTCIICIYIYNITYIYIYNI